MIFLNASEHRFNLSFPETIMLRNYARNNKYTFCSMIGGPESIRDIQEAKNLFTEAFEFSLIESEFSLVKIFSALEKVFNTDLGILSKKFIFINISTPDSFELIKNIKNFEIPNFLNKELIIFNFDRRSIARTFNKLRDNNFDYSKYEYEIEPLIFDKIKFLNGLNFKTCISGNIQKRSLLNNYEKYIFPNYLKTGLFTLFLKEKKIEQVIKEVLFYQDLEVQLLKVIKNALIYRHNYADERIIHLQKYLKKEKDGYQIN